MDVTFEPGGFGICAVVRSAWTPALQRTVASSGCVEIELNRAKGWRGDNVSFLAQLSHLKACRIVDLDLRSVEAVHALHDLEVLQVSTHCDTPLRFEEFPRLRQCGFEWRAGAESLFECRTLQSLSVNRLRSVRNLEVFAQLESLETLSLFSPSIESLDGLEALRVRVLRVALASRLRSIDAVSRAPMMRKLWLQSCTKIGDVSALGNCAGLTYLNLDRCGKVASLAPLANCADLEILFFWGTEIEDGDLTPLARLEKLQHLGFDNKRRYSHKLAHFPQAAATTTRPLFP